VPKRYSLYKEHTTGVYEESWTFLRKYILNIYYSRGKKSEDKRNRIISSVTQLKPTKNVNFKRLYYLTERR